MTLNPIRYLVTALALVILVPAAGAQGTDVLNPFTVASPSDDLRLRVQPSLMRGIGPCVLTMTRDGVELWQRELDTTAWHAAVTDEGRSILAAYRYGYTGHAHFNDEKVPNVITILVLDTNGTTLAREDIKRGGGMMHGPAEPTVTDVIALPGQDLGVVEVSSFGGPSDNWHRFRLSTGEKLAAVFPDHTDRAGGGNRFSIATEPIPGTPLVLRVWNRNYWGEDQPHIEGVRLAVLNRGGTAVWSRLFEGEQGREHEGAPWRAFRELQHQQAGVAERSFTFRSLVLDQTLTFECEQNENGDWSVIGKAAEPGCGLLDHPAITGIEPPKPLEQLATLDLDVIETVQLVKHKGPPSLIPRYTESHFDGLGRIGFVASGVDGIELRLISTQGEPLGASPLQFGHFEGKPRLVGRDDGTWLVYSEEYKAGRVWSLNPDTHEHRQIVEMSESREIESLVAMPDGGFAATVSDREEYSSTDLLVRVSPDGTELWTAELFSPEGLALGANNLIVVLDVIRHELSTYSFDGEPGQVYSVDDILGYEATYPSGLISDREDGFWLNDFGNSTPHVHLTPTFELTHKFHPRLPNGKRFGESGDIKTAPDGTIWHRDPLRFMRLAANGTADFVLGDDPESTELKHISRIGIGMDGNIHALNSASGYIHVLDPAGNEIRMQRADPKYKHENSTELHVEHDGTSVMVFRGGSRLRIDPEGNFVGISDGLMGGFAEYYAPNPHTPGGWVIGYESIAKIDADDQIVRQIHIAPDGNWLERPQSLAIAPDGSIAVSTGWESRSTDPRPRRDHTVCFFDPDGEPLGVMPAVTSARGPTRMLYDPPWLVFNAGHRLVVHDTRADDDGQYPQPRAIPMPQIEGLYDSWLIFRTTTPHEILAFRPGSTELLRIKLSED